MSVSETRLALDRFLATVEKRAFRMAVVAVGHSDEALDIVQDAMMKLVQHYSDRPEQQWRPLFFTILNNRISDWHRSQKSRWQVFAEWLSGTDEIERVSAAQNQNPLNKVKQWSALSVLEQAVGELPRGQQTVFMLRCWEGLNVRETAAAMKCSEGTVKTQYARALTRLQQQLGDEWP